MPLNNFICQDTLCIADREGRKVDCIGAGKTTFIILVELNNSFLYFQNAYLSL